MASPIPGNPPPPSPRRPPAGWKRGASFLFLAVLSLLLLSIDRPQIPGDDAAITFRYAQRLAGGHGPTYNDHERVQGFSNPLQMLLLGGLGRLGAPIPAASLAIGVASYVATIWIAFLLGARLAGAWGSWLAALGLLSSGFFRYHALGGMESIVAALLGVMVIACLGVGAEWYAGVLLGLAVVNKLDAALLVLAVLGAQAVVRRRLPLRTAAAAAAVAIPWLAFAWMYFGSSLPNSMIVKLTEHAHGAVARTWLLDLLGRTGSLPLLLPAALAVATCGRGDPGRRLVANALAAWFLLHLASFSLVDLGDAYPWYGVVLFPPLFILAGAAVPAALSWPGAARLRRRAAAGLAGLALLISVGGSGRTTLREIRHGEPVRAYEAFDLDRQLAGVFLQTYAEPDEIVASGFGWVAYASERPFNDSTRLNTRERLEPTAYVVVHGVPWNSGGTPPAIPEGYEPVATFDLANELAPGYSWFVVGALPTSSIYRRGIRFLSTPLDRFPTMTPLGESAGVDVRAVRGSIFAHAPSAFAFRFPAGDGLPRAFRVGAGFIRDADPRTDGVTFELRVDGETRFRSHRRPADGVAWVITPLPAGPTEVALFTEPGPAGDGDFDWAQWWSPRIRTGDARVDPMPIVGARLRQAWCERNACASGSRSVAPAS